MILSRDSYRCRACGASRDDGATLEVDHVRPIAEDGTDDLDNLATLCRECNRGKGALRLKDYRMPSPPLDAMSIALATHAAQGAQQDQRENAADSLLANVSRVIGLLRQLKQDAEAVRWSVNSASLHRQIEECRQEFVTLRPALRVLRERESVEAVGQWHEDVKKACDDLTNEYGAWEKMLMMGRTPPNLELGSPAERKGPDIYARLINSGLGHEYVSRDVIKKRVTEQGRNASR